MVTANPEAATTQRVQVLCQCCGEIIMVGDIHAFILSLHLQNVCPEVLGVVARD
jgi:hypothetical protein